jgi:tRNA (guanine37-N1)-methyltransferase
VYTRPLEFEGHAIPEILASGHHENIRKWRIRAALELTEKNRPDLLEKQPLSPEEKRIMESEGLPRSRKG